MLLGVVIFIAGAVVGGVFLVVYLIASFVRDLFLEIR